MISTDGEVGIRVDNSFQKVETLLPNSCHQCHDSSSA